MTDYDATRELREIIYVSQASSAVDEEALQDILQVARQFNKDNEVTGYLLYHNDTFLQVLEGPSHVLSDLMERIRSDNRNFNLRVLFDHAIAQRRFPDWSMGWFNLDYPSHSVQSDHHVGGFALSEEYLSSRLTIDIRPSSAYELISAFVPEAP